MPDRQSAITLRFLAEPNDSNILGNVHGGTVMRWIDQAGFACAVGWSGQICVTVYVGGIRFYKPVHIGHLIEVRARLIYTGHTSMHIAVDVWAGDPKDGIFSQNTHCIIIFVAIDDAGHPIPIPTWVPRSAQEIAMEKYARRLMDLRKRIEEEMGPQIQK
jgi:acyl-CoA hydrolase